MRRLVNPAALQAALIAIGSHIKGNPVLDVFSATRRALKTSDWTHDPERVAAAAAKRERRRARGRSSS